MNTAAHQAHLAAAHIIKTAHTAGNVAYVYVPGTPATTHSKLQHLATAEKHLLHTTQLAPPPGVYQAPAVGGGPVVCLCVYVCVLVCVCVCMYVCV